MRRRTIIEKIGSTSTDQLTPQLLKKLICGAKSNIQNDIDALCMYFKPLIYKESRRETVYRVLGEDAVNIAWEIFLRFIYRYNGADFVHLPGLIRCHIHYELLKIMKKQGTVWDNEVSADAAAEQLIDINDALERRMLTIALRQSLKALPALQRDILYRLYFKNMTLKSVSHLHSFCISNTVKHRCRGLKKLHKDIA